jgi:DNA-binding CsgD family transcriptional regulator
MSIASSHSGDSFHALPSFLEGGRLPPPRIRDQSLPRARQAEDREADSHPVFSALDRLGCGYVVLEHGRRVIEANATACAILACEAGDLRNMEEIGRAFRRLLERARSRTPLGALSWVVVSGRDEVPLVINQQSNEAPDGRSVVMLLDLDAHLEPNPCMLQRMFGLTMAETRLALQLAQGQVPTEIARRRRLSRTTVRSQLASIFAKTQTKRQAELVSLLTRVAVLP